MLTILLNVIFYSFLYYLIFLHILLNMLVIIKLCNFYVLFFCGITYYSYHLLHIILTILLNVIFYSLYVLRNVLTDFTRYANVSDNKIM